LTDVSEVLTASIIRVIATSTSETSVNFYQTTRRNIPEDINLHLILFIIPDFLLNLNVDYTNIKYYFHMKGRAWIEGFGEQGAEREYLGLIGGK
jgi:hypothetical protein